MIKKKSKKQYNFRVGKTIITASNLAEAYAIAKVPIPIQNKIEEPKLKRFHIKKGPGWYCSVEGFYGHRSNGGANHHNKYTEYIA